MVLARRYFIALFSAFRRLASCSAGWWKTALIAVLVVSLTMSFSGQATLRAAAAPLAPVTPASPVELLPNGLERTGSGLVRPDTVSASVTARASGQRVEVLSDRSGTSRRWALPTGGFQNESALAPVRFKDPAALADGWRDIDTTLVTGSDGKIRPVAVAAGMVLAGAGDPGRALITMGAGSEQFVLGAAASVSLPAPVLSGSTAVYPNVLPGVDVQVVVRPTGFEQTWVVKTRAGLTALLLANVVGGPSAVGAAMSAKGLTATTQGDGGVVLADSAGGVTGRFAAPRLWDGVVGPDGDPAHVSAARLAVVRTGSVSTAVSGLAVIPDLVWLNDPARVFPITIDPTYAAKTAGPSFDTYAQETSTSDNSAAGELRVGKATSSGLARTFMSFPQTAFDGQTIIAADLRLRELQSGTCSARGWGVWNSGNSSTSTRWTAQPTIISKYAVSTQTKGSGTSCPVGDVQIDMKSLMQYWTGSTPVSRGLTLEAESETDVTYYKRFASSETSTPPVLEWTYDRAPGQMAAPTPTLGVSYRPTGSSVSYLYASTTQLSVTGTMPSDPDGDVVNGRFNAFTDATTTAGSAAHGYCSNNTFVSSGSRVSCILNQDLSANTSYWIRSRARDANNVDGALSGPTEVRIASVKPTAPSISCPGLTNNTWTTTGPSANVNCTITATGTGYSAPSTIRVSVDGAAYTTLAITQPTSSVSVNKTVTMSNKTGGHSIKAYAANPAGLSSDQGLFQVGWGTASLDLPSNDPLVTTTDTVAVAATGQPRGSSSLPTAKVQWRVSGATGATGWKDAPAGTNFSVVDLGTAATKATAVFDTTLLVGQSDATPSTTITVSDRVATLIDVRVCLAYDSGSQCTGQSTVQRVPHAFGSGYPQAGAGPGSVALWTGELSVSDTDANLAAPDGWLSVSRSHNSFAGPADVQNRVFGPGWTASFDGDNSGAGGAEIWDNTYVDGTISVADADGGLMTFAAPGGGQRRTTAALPTGDYVPADDDTATAGVRLTVSGTGTTTVIEVKDDTSVVTKFQVTQAPTANAAAKFQTVEVRDPAVTGKTTYSYDSSGRVTAIVAPLPDGVTTCVPGTGAGTAGCRALKISYATTTTATASTPGDFIGQVKQITAQVNTDSDRPLATYSYDSTGQLVAQTDVRSNLTTTYTWTGTGTGLRLATYTPPGRAAYTFVYSNNKLFKVTSPNPASAGGGTAQLGAYLYNVPLSGTVTGLPNMTTEVAKWDQARDPSWAAAVFGQNKFITAAPAANSPDWLYAGLQFTDDQGYTLNNASYGAGDWQINAADYDDNGNVIHSWDERAIAGIRHGSLAGDSAASDSATLIAYNADITSDGTPGGSVVTPAGMLVTDTYGPVHDVVAADGTMKPLRTHTKTSYDQGAPNNGTNPNIGQPYRLPTMNAITAESATGEIDGGKPISISLIGYGSVVPSDTSGWDLGQATSTTADMDLSGTITVGDITSKTRYDARGRTIETRQPKSTGTDAGTRVTAYYTGASTGTAGCTSKPQWSGMTCQVGPAAQPAGQTMPVTTTTGYTWDLQPTTHVDASGSVTSTTTTSYDGKDRPTTVTTSVTGLPSSQSAPAITTSYDDLTGDITGTSSSAGSTAMTYDNWGRQLTYTNTPAGEPADSSTTTYDTNNYITSVVDNNGQTTYSYDGTDAAGVAERRSMVTAVRVKTTGGTEYTSTGAYDQAGTLTLEGLPGNLIRRTSIDVAGDQINLTVNGQGTNPDTGISDPDQPWLGWATLRNAKSQVVEENTPDNTDVGGTTRSNRAYAYDQAGRLTQVQDHTGTPDSNGTVSCATRIYRFDANGNRTRQSSIPSASDGSCTTNGGTTKNRAYDDADRPVTGANGSGSYVYDQIGRQITIPSVDSPNPSRGDTTLSYDDSDHIRTIKQGIVGSGGTQSDYSLDAAQRRLVQKTQNESGTTILTRHYTDPSDNPSWSVEMSAGASIVTRYSQVINGNLGITSATLNGSTNTSLSLSSPRGDINATIALTSAMNGPDSSPATGINGWTSYTEYGSPNVTDKVSTPASSSSFGYGWLGAFQRETGGDGFTLMGSRVYSPASGSFTSIDPIFGGNTTNYSYPQDSIQNNDTSGQQVWGACGLFTSPNKIVRTYRNVRGLKTVTLKCGGPKYTAEPSWGYRHLLWKRSRFESLAAVADMNWRDLVDEVIATVLTSPNKRNPPVGGKICFSRVLHLYNLRTGDLVKTQIFVVFVRVSDNSIVTAYPRSRQC